jgi:putative membrane protein
MATFCWLLLFSSTLIWSGINPKDTFTWSLEVAPAVIALIILALSRRRFPLTPLLYDLILVHSVILMIGGHYTYAEVPAFDWLAEQFDWQRNHYDKLGHFAQGFIPAMLARELLLRHQVINKTSWLNSIIVLICLGISALYELIEWWVAELSGEDAEAFLGTQGYVWDTQSDMAMAMIGAVVALMSLGRLHQHQLKLIHPGDSQPTAT